VVEGYDDLKDALKMRGWTENTNPLSSRFDFKWTLKIKDIEYNKLKDHQIVNHFEKNSCLTSEVRVCRNLRNLIGSDLIDIDEFYPRCYDLEDANDFEDFIEEFKFTKAEGLVKEFFKMKGSNIDKNRELVTKVAMAAIGRILDVYEKIHQILEIMFFYEILYDGLKGMGVLPVILQEEWAILEDLTTKHYDKSIFNKFLVFITKDVNKRSGLL
jgi:tubulin monoglycylase TTLL3/8